MIDVERSVVLFIDFQARLMPAIEHGESVVDRASRLQQAARLFNVSVLYTEQYSAGLGATIDALSPQGAEPVFEKMSFSAAELEPLQARLPPDCLLIVAGCETHVCVMQSVLGLLALNHSVFIVADATGSRHDTDRSVALQRMERHGAEPVTAEMVMFEWLRNAGHDKRRELLALVKPAR